MKVTQFLQLVSRRRYNIWIKVLAQRLFRLFEWFLRDAFVFPCRNTDEFALLVSVLITFWEQCVKRKSADLWTWPCTERKDDRAALYSLSCTPHKLIPVALCLKGKWLVEACKTVHCSPTCLTWYVDLSQAF